MSMPQSEDTHQSLLARIPQVTGRDVHAWLECLANGPGLLRFEERVNWLQDEHDIAHAYARAIVHEHDMRRAAVRTQPAVGWVDLEAARNYLRTHHHAVMATTRRDGTPQMSPITVSVDGDGFAVVSSRETAVKVKNLRRDPRAWICAIPDAFFGEPFVQVEGDVTIVDLPEAMDGLVDYYRSVSGEHPDWDDYRAAMVRDQRVLIKLAITRAGPDIEG